MIINKLKVGLRSILPVNIQKKLLKLRNLFILRINKLKAFGRKRDEIFGEIYRKNLWGRGGEDDFFSGPGSTAKYTVEYENYVSQFIMKNNINVLLDVGCGDFQVGKRILDYMDKRIVYIGVDMVDELIHRNKRLYSKDDVQFIKLDAVDDDLPKADLALIREVIQHLSIKSIKKLIKKLNNYKYVLITEHVVKNTSRPNIDIPDGQFARVDFESGTFLDKQPFNIDAEEVISVDLEDGVTCLRTLLITNDQVNSEEVFINN